MLPVELQRVLELPAKLRYSFALRLLAGMSASECGRLLSIAPEEVENYFHLFARIICGAAALTADSKAAWIVFNRHAHPRL
jgi:hypothetical protein